MTIWRPNAQPLWFSSLEVGRAVGGSTHYSHSQLLRKGRTMSKKTDRGAKGAGSSPALAPTSPAAFPLSASSLSMPSVPAGLAGPPTRQHSVELKFAEGSSFQSLPREEQKRMIDYLRTYRKELPRLLDEGEAGRFAVIKGNKVAHVWDTADDAIQAATLLIGTDQFAVYQVKPQDLDRLDWGENAKEPPCPQ